MKIIENNKKVEYPKKCVCTNCKSVLEVLEDDIKTIEVRSYDPIDQYNLTYKTRGFRCPCCNTNTTIKEYK